MLLGLPLRYTAKGHTFWEEVQKSRKMSVLFTDELLAVEQDGAHQPYSKYADLINAWDPALPPGPLRGGGLWSYFLVNETLGKV